ncbi:MAG: pyruvate ferredoxin oxidoreductase, partial [Woeseiaceae bacterium]|nr:pyruvate ferredoxin oxidoreductase [Woeseiaceae bacterium]
MATRAPLNRYPLDNYELDDRYRRESGRVFLTGTQALVRIPLMQRTLDKARGLNTAGFISGYRGSPLGNYDMELWRAKQYLAENNIDFLPAVNEDLAATAILGTQQVEAEPGKTVDGVFGIWYGKGPGVDRSGDALKHGNAYGSSPNGGVLVVAGDDHGCVSSSMPHQSDVAFMSWLMPVLNPANVTEYLEYGLYGIALSRFSGMWVGFKAISETVESAMSVELPPYPEFISPPDFAAPASGLHIRWPDFPGPQIEERLEHKKAATLAFAEANPLDHTVWQTPNARYGIVTTGKGHLDLMEALRMLDIDQAEARRIGLEVYKVGMVWPLAHDSALDFVKDKHEVLVVEEKRGIIESQFKEYFYDYPGRKPQRMVGKEDENGNRLVPWTGELAPLQLATIVAKRLDDAMPGLNLTERANALLNREQHVIQIAGAKRIPYF